MKIHREFEQRSMEWALARAGRVTASEMDAIISPTFKARDGEMPKTYLAKKLAEKWLGGNLPGSASFDMDQGNILEDEARPRLALELGVDIESVGLIANDDGTLACSPDGLIAEREGVEIKCPAEHTHVRYLLAGVVPPDYVVQVHSSMLISGLKSWKFFSYCRRFPPLLLTVERDHEIQEKIAEALDNFLEQFNFGYKRLEEINGGPPRRVTRTEKPKPQLVTDDTPH